MPVRRLESSRQHRLMQEFNPAVYPTFAKDGRLVSFGSSVHNAQLMGDLFDREVRPIDQKRFNLHLPRRQLVRIITAVRTLHKNPQNLVTDPRCHSLHGTSVVGNTPTLLLLRYVMFLTVLVLLNANESVC